MIVDFSRGDMRERHIKFICFTLCLCFLVFLGVKFYSFNRFPPVWDDESSYILPAATLMKGEGLKTRIHADFVPGMGERTYWMTPLLFVAYAPFTRLFGIDPLGGRVFIALVTLALFALLWWALRFLGGRTRGTNGVCLALTALSLFACSRGFLNSFPVFRMELLVLVWLVPGVVEYVRFIDTGRVRHLGIAGFFSALAVMTHPIGVLFPAAVGLHTLVSLRRSDYPGKWKGLAFAVGLALLVFSPWIAYILRDPGSFFAQMSLQFLRKGERYREAGDYLKLAVGILVEPTPFHLLLPLVSYVVLRRAGAERKIASFLLVVTFLFRFGVAYSREMWYPVYDYFWFALNFFYFSRYVFEPGRGREALSLAVSLVLIFPVVFGGGKFLYRNLDLVTGGKEYRRFVGDVEKAAERLDEGVRVLALGNPNLVAPFLENGADVQVPRFREKGEIDAGVVNRYDYILFFANNSREYGWATRRFLSRLSPGIARKLRGKIRGDRLFQVLLVPR